MIAYRAFIVRCGLNRVEQSCQDVSRLFTLSERCFRLDREMTKKFGFWTLTFLVVANMVGAGLFTTSGFSLADLQAPYLVILAWAVGGVLALSGAVGYGQLVQAIPESGGEYLFLSRAAHPILGFIAGWVSMIAGFSGAIALAATVFEGYVTPERLRPSWLPQGAVAISVICLAGGMHGLRPRVGALAQNIVVILKLGLLIGILAFAAGHMPTNVSHETGNNQDALSGWALINAFAGSLVWISLSYAGFNAAVYVAEEVEDAKRVVPRAMVMGTGVVMILYVLLNAVFVYGGPPERVIGKEDIAAIAANSLGGPRFEIFVRGTIAACLLTSVFSMMMAAPRVYAKMAEDGFLPHRLRFNGDSPRGATSVQVLIAVVLVLVSSLQGLLTYLGMTLSLSSACSVGCLFLPRMRQCSMLHPRLWMPTVFVIGTVTSAAMLGIHNPWQVIGTALTFGMGALAYVFVWRTKS